MTKRKSTRNVATGKLGSDEMLATIRLKTTVIEKMLAGPLPEDMRTQLLERLEEAVTALQAPTWKWSTVSGAIVQILDLNAHHFEGWGEEYSVEHVTAAIVGVMNDRDAPEECRGRAPDRADVRRCILAWQRRRGRPTKEQAFRLRAIPTRDEALLSLLGGLQVTGATTPDAANKARARYRKSRSSK